MRLKGVYCGKKVFKATGMVDDLLVHLRRWGASISPGDSTSFGHNDERVVLDQVGNL